MKSILHEKSNKTCVLLDLLNFLKNHRLGVRDSHR